MVADGALARLVQMRNARRALLPAEVEDQVAGEAVGVVEVVEVVLGEGAAEAGAGEDPAAAVEEAGEAVLLLEEHPADRLRVDVLAEVVQGVPDQLLRQVTESAPRVVPAQHGEHPAEQAAQDVAAAGVGGADTVADDDDGRAQVVADQAQGRLVQLPEGRYEAAPGVEDVALEDGGAKKCVIFGLNGIFFKRK